MDSWKKDIIRALNNLGGSADYDEIYDEIEKIRPNLEGTWKSSVRRRIQDFSSDSEGYKGIEDLFFSVEGIGSGSWGLRSKLKETPKASDLPDGNDKPERTFTITYRILRDSSLARKIKVLHNHSCQICSDTIEFPNGERYSEAHHIIPLGKKHDGPDVAENIIVLCPRHHVLCDYGAIQLDMNDLNNIQNHMLSIDSIKYHNDIIFNKIL